MTLPRNYKFHIVNNTGVQIDFALDGVNNTFEIKARPWKYDSNGALVYGAEITLFADPTADLADAASLEAATAIDNSVNLYLGLHATATLVTDAATGTGQGTIDVFMEHSTDGGTTYPSDSADFQAERDLGPPVVKVPTSTTNDDRGVNFTL